MFFCTKPDDDEELSFLLSRLLCVQARVRSNSPALINLQNCCHASLAARLEACDDTLTCVFASLSLVERLRLLTVSKRWLRLLLVDVRFPSEHVWRAPAVLKRAGNALRSLQLAGVGDVYSIYTGQSEFREILRALSACPESQLGMLVTWEPRLDAEHWQKEQPALSKEEAMQLAASCPRLGERTCLCLRAEEDAAQAITMLDALPGRHAVQLRRARGKGFPLPEALLRVLLRHPRLQALIFDVSKISWDEDQFGYDDDEEDGDVPEEHRASKRRSIAAAAFDAVATALQTGAALRLEAVSLCSDRERADPRPAFASAAAVEAAFEAAATGPGGPAPWPLRRLSLEGSLTCPGLTRAALVASRGSLQHLRVCVSHALVCAHGGGAAALAALLGYVGGSLELLHLESSAGLSAPSTWRETPFLPGLVPLLSSADCRLHTLSVGGVNFTNLARLAPELRDLQQPGHPAPPASPLEGFLAALSSNRSLTALHIKGCKWSEMEMERFAAALGGRASPLKELYLCCSHLPPGGAPLAPPTCHALRHRAAAVERLPRRNLRLWLCAFCFVLSSTTGSSLAFQSETSRPIPQASRHSSVASRRCGSPSA